MRVRSLVALAAAALAFPTPSAAQARGPRSLLIKPAELSRALRDPTLVILQVGPKEDYDAGHVPGARLIEMQDLAAARVEGGPVLELQDEATLRAKLESFGIGDASLVVVVPGEDWGSPATRIMWTLQVAGLGGRSQLLEGGSRGWKAAGLPVSTEAPPAAKPGRLTLAQDRSIVVTHQWVESRLGQKDFHLIDGRAPVFYEGPGMNDQRGMKHDAGHVPGARNIPFNTLFNDSLQFLPLEALAKTFSAAGVAPGDTVVAYCHIGQQATMVLFSARLLGHPIKLYDGSFTEWESLKLPIENATRPATPPAR